MSATGVSVPPFQDLLTPTLEALRELGGSARIDEISSRVIEREGFSEEQQTLRRSPGHHMSALDYRLAWARNYLKNVGAITNSARGVWAITDLGSAMTDAEVRERVKVWKAEYNRRYLQRKRDAAESADDVEVGEEVEDLEPVDGWREQLLGRLMEVPPAAFERMAQRLLREAGFRNVEVLGKSGDGGLDGVGVYRLSLVSFPVFFQCKRFRGSVGSGAVRDFRGAMSGRGEKGMLITTGSFTRDAQAEASRDGAPPVELIDGDDLCDLLKQYGLGVVTTERIIEEVTIDETFIESL